MSESQERRSPGGNPGFETADNNNLQAQSSAVLGTCGDRPAGRLLRLVPTGPEALAAPIYAHEILRAQAAGGLRTYVIFGGPGAHQAAFDHRVKHGAGTVTALLDDADPAGIRWPSAHTVTVSWPDTSEHSLDQKAALAYALRRDGVRYAAFTHAVAWPNLWPERVARGTGRRGRPQAVPNA